MVSLESGRTTSVLTTHLKTKPSEGRVERGEGERGKYGPWPWVQACQVPGTILSFRPCPGCPRKR